MNRSTLNRLVETLARPYPHGPLIVVVWLYIHVYFFIGRPGPGPPFYNPEIALDRTVQLEPSWILVYASLYVFVLLPLLVVRQDDLFRRTLLAYLMVMTVAYLCFLINPTASPRPASVAGNDYFAWGLRLNYSLDVPYNCFPSLHVSHSFVSALACYRVHRGIGIAAVLWATLIGVSTVYTKQHYIVDAIAGMLVALVAYFVLMRHTPREVIPAIDTRLAPARALNVIWILAIILACTWVAYQMVGP